MSYPFQGGPGSHPYPPSMSYPTAPSVPGQYPPYPQQNPGYPPGQNPYPAGQPGYPGSNPYPTGQTPYPSSTPYPNTAPYPTQPSYPPSYPVSTPYPSQPNCANSAPYPSQPNCSNSASYPVSTPYSSQTSYPTQGYPSQATPYPLSPLNPQSGVGNPPYPGGNLYPNLGSHVSQPLGHHAPGGIYQTSPTVRPANPFNPRGDAEVLRKAMKGIGTDETAIIAVLSKRTNSQRQEIAREFKTLYGKDLIKDLKSETSGKFEQLIVAMMTPIHEYYASEVHHAISGVGTNESTLIEVLCTLNNAELHYVKQVYQKLYGSTMESHLSSDTSGNFKRLLVSLCQGRRDESHQVNTAGAEADAVALHQAGELKFGTDESTFNAILCSRSFVQLQAVFAAYERITKHPFEKAVKSEFSGDIEDGLLAIVHCVRNKTSYLAECLRKSMAGAGTNDRALIRLMVTRSEVDLEAIKQQFLKNTGKTVESFIKGDTSGDYKKLLLALLG